MALTRKIKCIRQFFILHHLLNRFYDLIKLLCLKDLGKYLVIVGL